MFDTFTQKFPRDYTAAYTNNYATDYECVSPIVPSLYFTHRIGGNRNVNTIDERRSKIVRNRVFDCHLSPDRREMAIENTVSNEF